MARVTTMPDCCAACIAARVEGVISPLGFRRVPSISITSNDMCVGVVSILLPRVLFQDPLRGRYPMHNDDATGHFARRMFPGVGLLLLYAIGLAQARRVCARSLDNLHPLLLQFPL